jgi:hypothetical protein
MSCTPAGCTSGGNASLHKASSLGRPLIADQRVAAGAPRAAEGAHPPAPTPPTPARACLSAPPRGDHERSQDPAARGGGEESPIGPGAGVRKRRARPAHFTAAQDRVLLEGKAAGLTYAQIAETLPHTRDQLANRSNYLARRGHGVRRPKRPGPDSKPQAQHALPPCRPCLTCGQRFQPPARAIFVCAACKTSLAWRIGA